MALALLALRGQYMDYLREEKDAKSTDTNLGASREKLAGCLFGCVCVLSSLFTIFVEPRGAEVPMPPKEKKRKKIHAITVNKTDANEIHPTPVARVFCNGGTTKI